MVFSKPLIGTIPNSSMSFKRINIGTRNEDGTLGELIFETERLFSFGISENTDPSSGKITGYSMGLCMWSKDGATKKEKEWTDTYNAVVEKCKDHLIETSSSVGLHDLEKSDLKKFGALYRKRDDKGKIVESVGPTLSAKLIQNKKDNNVMTVFYDQNGNDINYTSLVGKKFCNIKGAIKIESIFIGAKIAFQVKLYETEVQMIESGMKRLLPRPIVKPAVTTTTASNPLLDDEPTQPTQPINPITNKSPVTAKKPETGYTSDGSIDGSDSDEEKEEEEVVKPLAKKTVTPSVRVPLKKK
jgi:hypothetical protein